MAAVDHSFADLPRGIPHFGFLEKVGILKFQNGQNLLKYNLPWKCQ